MSITLAGQKAPSHRPLTPYHLKPRLLSPRALEEGVLRSWGEDTHIVPLVKVDGAGDRRETLIPVVTVPVHSRGHTGGGEARDQKEFLGSRGEWVGSHSRAPDKAQNAQRQKRARVTALSLPPLNLHLTLRGPGGMWGALMQGWGKGGRGSLHQHPMIAERRKSAGP